jgi:hypothetical protein
VSPCDYCIRPVAAEQPESRRQRSAHLGDRHRQAGVATVREPARLDANDASTNQIAISPTLGIVLYAAQSNAVYMVDLSRSTPGQPAQLFPATTATTRIALGE